MSRLQFSKGKFSKFIASKGFYVAVGVCLIGAGAATWLAVDQTLTGIENANRQVLEQGGQNERPLPGGAEEKAGGNAEPAQAAEAAKTDIPKPSLPASSTPAPALPAQAAAPAAQSQPEEQLQVSPTVVYTLPVSGNILNRFSKGELVKNKTLNDWRTHDGVDIAADKGTDVLAAAEGTVAQIKKDDLWGVTILIHHADGLHSLYCGLNERVSVKEGERVTAKQAIGKVEGVPCEVSEATHIHFAMQMEGIWVDPLAMLA